MATFEFTVPSFLDFPFFCKQYFKNNVTLTRRRCVELWQTLMDSTQCNHQCSAFRLIRKHNCWNKFVSTGFSFRTCSFCIFYLLFYTLGLNPKSIIVISHLFPSLCRSISYVDDSDLMTIWSPWYLAVFFLRNLPFLVRLHRSPWKRWHWLSAGQFGPWQVTTWVIYSFINLWKGYNMSYKFTYKPIDRLQHELHLTLFLSSMHTSFQWTCVCNGISLAHVVASES